MIQCFIIVASRCLCNFLGEFQYDTTWRKDNEANDLYNILFMLHPTSKPCAYLNNKSHTFSFGTYFFFFFFLTSIIVVGTTRECHIDVKSDRKQWIYNNICTRNKVKISDFC